MWDNNNSNTQPAARPAVEDCLAAQRIPSCMTHEEALELLGVGPDLPLLERIEAVKEAVRKLRPWEIKKMYDLVRRRGGPVWGRATR